MNNIPPTKFVALRMFPYGEVGEVGGYSPVYVEALARVDPEKRIFQPLPRVMANNALWAFYCISGLNAHF